MKKYLDYLPPILNELAQIKIISVPEDEILQKQWQAVEVITNDQWISTMTERGIIRREKILNIKPYANDTLETRRARIFERWNENRPYTYRRLIQIFDMICGFDRYMIELIHNDYKLTIRLIEVKVGDYRKTLFYDLHSMAKRVVPANLIFIVMQYDLIIIIVPIEIYSQLKLISFFGIRKESEKLYLDGSWNLDGTYWLNGYKSISWIDYYPLYLKLTSYINVKIETIFIYNQKNSFQVDISERLNLKLYSNFKLRKFPDNLYLDGSWYLDETYWLNGYKNTKWVDFYPCFLKIIDNFKPIVKVDCVNKSNFCFIVKIKSYNGLTNINNIKVKSKVNTDIALTSDTNLKFNYDCKSKYNGNFIIKTKSHNKLRDINNIKIKSKVNTDTTLTAYTNININYNGSSKDKGYFIVKAKSHNELRDINNIKIKSKVNLSLKLANKMQTQINQNSTLTITRDVWKLDGTYFLDGDRILGIEIIESIL